MKHELSFIAAAMLFAGTLSAQSLNIHLKNGEKVEYTAEEVEYVDFTEAQSNSYNGHEYVDLGLPSGLKWATCNVGASAPEEYGDYYAWGEIETKDKYGRLQYKYYSDGVYNDLGDISGTEYDVARQKWGSSWRMPNKSEFEELIDACTWSWDNVNNVNGYKVTGPNGNWIFLPAAGYHNVTEIYGYGTAGYYWSSTPGLGKGQAYQLILFDYRIVFDYNSFNYRYYGMRIRPVIE